ncbi:NAD(P)H-dependent flavin oxidoreductase [Lactobacillus delbrueckii]|uniref:NAD(P)H-dependent flavin oxidoreductase n=1 Tax=Lactobacillus delbrueckii TaxID=1584 RepID=UPI001E36C5F9|nr:nitronate monooxygenase [Lactobacillus delbrueckii]MCD5503914.1 nitronate monooxygenase [Lactobacillus delbrueckii subsp. lactis]
MPKPPVQAICSLATRVEGGTVPAKVIGTFAILPLIVDAADGKVPVVAAGGLVDKRTVRAAFDLGAEGVYAGTAFLATEESPLAENIKQDMLKYDADDLLMFRAPNSFYRSLPGELPEKLLEMDKQGKSAAEIWAAADDYNCLLYGMHDGDLSRGIVSFGLGISSIHSIDPVSVVVDRLNSGVIA